MRDKTGRLTRNRRNISSGSLEFPRENIPFYFYQSNLRFARARTARVRYRRNARDPYDTDRYVGEKRLHTMEARSISLYRPLASTRQTRWVSSKHATWAEHLYRESGSDPVEKSAVPISCRPFTMGIEKTVERWRSIARAGRRHLACRRDGTVACAGVRACNVVVYQFRGPGRLRGDRKGDVIGAHGRIGGRWVARKFDRARRVLRKPRGPSIVLCCRGVCYKRYDTRRHNLETHPSLARLSSNGRWNLLANPRNAAE